MSLSNNLENLQLEYSDSDGSESENSGNQSSTSLSSQGSTSTSNQNSTKNSKKHKDRKSLLTQSQIEEKLLEEELLEKALEEEFLLQEKKCREKLEFRERQHFFRNFSRKTYVQTCQSEFITGPQLQQFIGIASYHFGDTKEDCYIDYSKAPDAWKFDAIEQNDEEDDAVIEGENDRVVYEKFNDLPQSRKYFTNVKIGPHPKEFYGEIEWTLDGVSVGGTTKWVYHFTLDDNFAHISTGKCFMYRMARNYLEPIQFF